MKVLYFSWVRERVGLAEEEISLPPDFETVAELVDWLAARGEAYAAAFANRTGVRVALDRTHAPPQTAIGSAREIAFFPPMTGG